MKAFVKLFLAILFFVSAYNFGYAQNETQEQFFQKYQAMVIIEEFNQHCPMLSRVEAEALNGQIVFANNSFGGKLDGVDKFKKEARIFTRRAACNTPEILSLVGAARQQASDSLVNHILLAREIHILDQQSVEDGKIQSGLLLNFLQDTEWQMIEEFYLDVKNNYLTQANEEAWDKYIESVENVADENRAEKYLINANKMNSGAAESFDNVQARANNKSITGYYHNLEKTIRAFIEGAEAQKTDYPYSRPANDFTNWASFRPRTGKLNWVTSYHGCGGNFNQVDCVLFITPSGEMGLVLSSDQNIENVNLSFRNPENEEVYATFKTVEGPIGSNQVNMDHLNGNVEGMFLSEDKKTIEADLSEAHDYLKVQTGRRAIGNEVVYIFPESTLTEMEKLLKNDVIKLMVEIKGEDGVIQIEGLMPIHNYHRAKNWAYEVQN